MNSEIQFTLTECAGKGSFGSFYKASAVEYWQEIAFFLCFLTGCADLTTLLNKSLP